MKILVLNCGSSSIKYQLFNMENQDVIAKGIVEKVGLQGSFMKYKNIKGDEARFEGEILDHQMGIEYVLGVLVSQKYGCIGSLSEIDAVGHRVAHGGEFFKESAYLDEAAIKEIEKISDLAPLHNPANLKGIYAMQSLLPGAKQVAVFDTSFHQTMPAHSFMYGIPYSLYKKYGIRRYGFHGTSHRFISQVACETLGVDIKTQKIITCHLGNGASLAAIKNGESIDTSMGFTPVEGLIMGTRTGDLDLGALMYIMEKEEIGLAATNTLINKFSGVLGISGVSSDMREVEIEAWENGNQRALLALQMYHYRIRKYIGAYAAAMGGADIIIFAGGVGENGPETRRDICKNFEFMGLEIDNDANFDRSKRGKINIISKPESKVIAMVVPTNEELVIAEDTQSIVSKLK
jgi:acetate kinase